MDRALVPCNGCTACCRNTRVLVHSVLGDNPEDYETEDYQGLRVLKRKPSGDCIYLEDSGCTIWERPPAQCREFDCRRAVQLELRHNLSKAVVEAGFARIHTLELQCH